jgi:hypothetical protein
VPQRWRENISFHAFLPPKSFQAKFSSD